MTAKITSISDNIGSLGTNKGEAFRFGDDNSGQLAGFRNKLINGDFRIWQRGNNFSLTGQWTQTFCADRWILALDSAGASISASFGQDAGAAVGWPEAATYIIINGTNLGLVEPGYIIQRVEDVRTCSNKRVVLSYVEQLLSGADTATMKPFLSQRFGTGGSANVNIQPTSDVKVGQKRILVFDIPTTLGKTIGANSNLSVIIPMSGTFSKAFSGIQLEEGSIATPFEQRPIGLELSLCQRYYEKSTQRISASQSDTVAVSRSTAFFKTTKRITNPTITLGTQVSGGGTPITENASSEGFMYGANSPTASVVFQGYTAEAEL